MPGPHRDEPPGESSERPDPPAAASPRTAAERLGAGARRARPGRAAPPAAPAALKARPRPAAQRPRARRLGPDGPARPGPAPRARAARRLPPGTWASARRLLGVASGGARPWRGTTARLRRLQAEARPGPRPALLRRRSCPSLAPVLARRRSAASGRRRRNEATLPPAAARGRPLPGRRSDRRGRRALPGAGLSVRPRDGPARSLRRGAALGRNVRRARISRGGAGSDRTAPVAPRGPAAVRRVWRAQMIPAGTKARTWRALIRNISLKPKNKMCFYGAKR